MKQSQKIYVKLYTFAYNDQKSTGYISLFSVDPFCLLQSVFSLLLSAKSYPAINGRVSLTDVTFARFQENPCGMESYVFTNNPLSPDAMHPFQLTRTCLRDVSTTRKVFFHPPNPAWINQEVEKKSIDMEPCLQPLCLLFIVTLNFLDPQSPTFLLPCLLWHSHGLLWNADLSVDAANSNVE